MSRRTPLTLRRLQEALDAKAKQEPGCRFHSLYDTVWREDVMAQAWALSRHHGGAPGVDDQTFADVEAYGIGRWLEQFPLWRTAGDS